MIMTDSFKDSDLMNVSLKINRLRNLIDEHIISIESDFGNIIDDIDDDKTVDNIIDSVINSVSENTQSSYLSESVNDENNTEQISETSDKNSFSVSTGRDINITSDISNFLNTETETSYTSNNYKNKNKKYKMSN